MPGGFSRQDIEKLVAEALEKSLPSVLARSLSTGVPQQAPPNDAQSGLPDTGEQSQVQEQSPRDIPTPDNSRFERFYMPQKKVQLSNELLSLTTEAFVKSLPKDTWKGLTENYPDIQRTESVLVAPTMETGMKEDIRKKHGHSKTKEVFSFDDGLAEKQSAFLLAARPIVAALTTLDGTGEDIDEDEAPDPDVIRGMLEDALVLLGNANARLNSWRQRRFADFLTPIGKHTLKEEIPTDKHLFPDELHERIRSEHSHSTTNNNLISKPPDRQQFSGSRPTYQKPFRANSTYAAKPSWRKRKWNYSSSVNNANAGGPSKRHFTKSSSNNKS